MDTGAVARTYLITGANGFVGSHLLQYVLKRGREKLHGGVRVLVRKPEQVETLSRLGVEVVVGDLTDTDSLKRAVEGVYGIYHIAAEFRRAGISDAEYVRANVEGTRNLLDVAIGAGVERFIHCSTVGVLGHVKDPPADEACPYNPGDIYQHSKVAGEKVALSYFESGKIKGVVIRPGMIWGPGDTRTLKLFKTIATGRFMYVGRGEALVHFVDVRDLAVSFEKAMHHEQLTNEVFIVAGKTSVPLRELVSMIARECGVPEPSIHLPLRPVWLLGLMCELVCKPFGIEPPLFRRRVDFFTKNRSFDTSKAQRLLQFQPAQSLEQEISDIVAWYQAYGWIPMPQKDGVEGHAPSFMVRDIKGNIKEWGGAAEQVYGWNSQKARGAISHELLATSFPEPIDKINQEVLTKKRWDGPLVHCCKDGSPIEVHSSWRLLPEGGNGDALILELNWPRRSELSNGKVENVTQRQVAKVMTGALLSAKANLIETVSNFV